MLHQYIVNGLVTNSTVHVNCTFSEQRLISIAEERPRARVVTENGAVLILRKSIRY